MADRYWVGGTGNTNDTAKWSATSGGAGGASVPTSADNAIWNGSSGTGTATINATFSCLSATFTGYTGSLTHTASITWNIFGSLTMVSGMTYTRNANSAIVFAATSGSFNITTGGKILPLVTIGGASGTPTWTLQDTNTADTMTHSRGTLTTNNQACNWGTFAAVGSNTLVFNMGSSIFTISGTTATPWNVSATNFTVNVGTSTIRMTGNANRTFAGNNRTWYALEITGTGIFTITGANSFTNLSRAMPATNLAEYFDLGGNQTVTGTFTATGNALNRRLCVRSNVQSTRRTITAAAVSLTNVDFRDIGGAGAASWTGTSVGNHKNNSGITFTTNKTVYWVGDGGNWAADAASNFAATSGGSPSINNFPLAQDTLRFDANSFTTGGATVTTDVQMLPGIDWTGVTNNPTWSMFNFQYHFGNITFSPNMTLAGDGVYIPTEGCTITTNGLVISWYAWVYGSSMSDSPITLADNYTTTHANNYIYLFRGHLDVTGRTLNMPSMIIENSGEQDMKLTSTNATFNLSLSSGNVWDNTNGMLTSANHIGQSSTTINIIDTSNVQKNLITWGQFSPGTVSVPAGSKVYWYNGTASCTNLILNGPCEFAHQSSFTLTVTNITINSGASNVVTIRATVPGTQGTISKSSGTVNARNVDVKDSAAVGGATWNVWNGTNSGNNTGWIFNTDITNPTVNITAGPSKATISDETGEDSSSITFQVNEVYDAYQLRVVTNTTDLVTQGTLIESGSGGPANTDREVTVTDDELVAAGYGDGTHRIKVFAQDLAGNWSTNA